MSRKAPSWDRNVIEQLRRELRVAAISPVPLHGQISQGLQRWLATRSVGQRLPSERRLATLLRVDRATIARAMRDFVTDGVLVRRVKGTFLVRQPDMTEPSPSGEMTRLARGAHPLALQAHDPVALANTLHLVLFENLPHQRIVWEALVNRFNQSNVDLRMEIIWLPPEVGTKAAYYEYLLRHKPDLMLLDQITAARLKRADALSALPADVAEELRGPAFLGGMPGLDRDDLLSYAVPLHFGPTVFLWNERLAGDLSPRLPSPPNLENIVSFICRLKVSLPNDCCFIANMWELLLAMGAPLTGFRNSLTWDYFKRLFATLQLLAEHASQCLWYEARPLAATERFLDGKAAFYFGNLNAILRGTIPGQLPRWNGVFLLPEPGQGLSTGCSLLAGLKPNRLVDLDKVFRFFASEPVQKAFAAGGVNCVFRQAGNHAIQSYLRATNLRDLETAAAHLIIADEDLERGWVSFMARDLRALARQVLEGLPPEEAATQAMALAKQHGINQHPPESKDV